MANVKIEEIVRKLFAKANDASVTEAEAALYMDKVNKLLIEYNLSKDILNSKNQEDCEIDEETLVFPYYTSAYGSLAVSTARLFFCEVFRRKVDNKQKKIITPKGVQYAQIDAFVFVGKAHNRIVAISMMQFFTKTIRRLASQYTDNQTEKNRFAVGACFSLCRRILAKIKENENEKVAPGSSGGLPALIINEAAANKAYMENEYGKMNKGRKGRKVAMTDAVKAGSVAANGISLNSQIEKKEEYLKII